MLERGEQTLIYFIKLMLDQKKLHKLDFTNFSDYLEVDSEVVSIFYDDELNQMAYLAHKPPLIDGTVENKNK